MNKYKTVVQGNNKYWHKYVFLPGEWFRLILKDRKVSASLGNITLHIGNVMVYTIQSTLNWQGRNKAQPSTESHDDVTR